MTESPQNHEPEAPEADEPAPPSIRDLNVPLILTIGIVSVLLLIVAIIGTQAWFTHEVKQERQKKVLSQPFPELDGDMNVTELNRQQEQVLQGPAAWKDRSKGIVTVPIDQAIDRFVAKSQQSDQAP